MFGTSKSQPVPSVHPLHRFIPIAPFLRSQLPFLLTLRREHTKENIVVTFVSRHPSILFPTNWQSGLLSPSVVSSLTQDFYLSSNGTSVFPSLSGWDPCDECSIGTRCSFLNSRKYILFIPKNFSLIWYISPFLYLFSFLHTFKFFTILEVTPTSYLMNNLLPIVFQFKVLILRWVYVDFVDYVLLEHTRRSLNSIRSDVFGWPRFWMFESLSLGPMGGNKYR